MSGAVVALVVVGVAVFFVLGLLAGRYLMRARERQAVVPVASALATVSPQALLLPETDARSEHPLAVLSDGGLDLVIDALPSDNLPATSMVSHKIASSSRLVSELARLTNAGGSVASSGKDLYRMAVNGQRLMRARGGGYRANFVNAQHRITGQGVLKPVGASQVVSVLGPQLVWAVAAVAVGQHFEAEISKRLEGIERKLDCLLDALDQQRLAELSAASRECENMALRLIDGVDPGEAVVGLSAQKQVIGTNWMRSLEMLAAAEKKLSELRSHEGALKASQLVSTWDELFGDGTRFSRDVRLFLSSLSAKIRLTALLAADEAASARNGGAAEAYRARLFEEMRECHDALRRFRLLIHEIVRLEYRVDASEWVPASLFQKGKTQKGNRLLATMRGLLDLEDELEQLQLPFASPDLFPDYQLLARPHSDGSYDVGLERVVVPVEVTPR